MNPLKSVLLIVALTLVATLVLAQDRNQAQQFQEAINVMETKGNYTAAIRLFEQTAKGADRTLAARALYYVGQCYEKSGKAKAQQAYQRVIKQFAEQRQVVAEARARLSALSPSAGNVTATKAASGPIVRQVWAGPDADGMGQPSPDGRFLSFVDWATGDLAIRDLTTSENRRLTNKGSYQQSKEEAGESIFSPDGKRLAYLWLNKDDSYDLRLIGVDGAGLRVLYKSKSYAWPQDWSQDGKYILAEAVQERNHQILLISVADGWVRVLKSLPSYAPTIFP